MANKNIALFTFTLQLLQIVLLVNLVSGVIFLSNNNATQIEIRIEVENKNSSTESSTVVTLNESSSELPVRDEKVNLDVKPPVEPQAKLQINARTVDDCPSLENVDSLTQTQLFKRLVHPCRYDRIQRAEPRDELGKVLPVDVFVRFYIYFLQNLEAHDLQYKMHALLQFRYDDPRLAFKKFSKRKSPILGENDLRQEMWVPHIFFANEQSSGILGTYEKDILVSISPDGTVLISTRIEATLFCNMDLRKFPFDLQQCTTVLENWKFNVTNVQLHWELEKPIVMGPNQRLTEYILFNFFTNDSVVNADTNNFRHGAFTGNYSSLSFTVTLCRQIGYYLLDYFLPSIMIVAMSWLSFWLQADQTAPRIMVGTATMLTFITLSSSEGKTLPKVSYIKASEIWFMGCTGFIFSSLVEFAFVNTIWRRRKHVPLEKVNASNILRHTFARALAPESLKERLGFKPPLNIQKRSHSCSSLKNFKTDKLQEDACKRKVERNNVVNHGVGSMSSNLEDPYANGEMSDRISDVSITIEETPQESHSHHTWTTMTPQEISNWIDKRSRAVFPVAFIIFNIFYWTFVNVHLYKEIEY